MNEALEESSWTGTSVTGTKRSKFRVLYELGRGGMARVYLAERRSGSLTKLVVLKVMDPSLAMDDGMRSLFRKEATICARLNHPNIVQVYEVLDDVKLPTMVMEYIDGLSFAQIKRNPSSAFPLRLQLHVLSQVLAALNYFHEIEDSGGALLNAVHRDVTPQNVIVMHAGVVKVLDFGVAKVRSENSTGDETQTGVVKGKLKYMPKEQVMADASIDRRADVFAVGVMLWETFAGKRMWGDKHPPEIYQALLTDKLPDIKQACPRISPAWEEIVRRATAPNREDRYSTALQMQLAMEEAMAEFGGPVRQRELAEFMAEQYGGLRREQSVRLEQERQKATPLNIPGLESTGAHTMVGSTVTLNPFGTRHDVRRTLLAAAVPASILALGAALFFGEAFGPSQVEPAEVVATQPAELIVNAYPKNATIELDGKPATNPLSQHFIPSEKTHKLVVSAEGYNSETREIVVDRAMSLEVRLAKLDKTESPTAAVELDSLGTVEVGDDTPAKKTAKAPRPTTTIKRPSVKKKAASPNCSPPYKIGADGVKTFKLECL